MGVVQWYSPVLKRKLAGHVADCVVTPKTEEELAKVLSFAAINKIAVIPSGGGTGNYGQIIPLEKGILIDTSELNERKSTMESDVSGWELN
ncbi:hypothetical protein AJ85_10825 [Alkalihalobacillus alcalophilus ATCC 27647 = CGMCC 1.3604]|uniref:FAD-binding PCMH-type domain-containing protein n=1 Tax=Alkalihalobacillus alcalophilus ATCC 27647 = CGMCC 1.3604 TaxID=1218173 RepID=A0A4S4JZX3_ALKAL|nr:FAD-binding protein [Alkalihalobacillus alcalophilus]MED1563376.1 FAD-binding protein [Alkalihalobacillus alcalophilus]THG90410.1 hypothetical protein AJ85_10825 [Alkalihalobacillus alcalophilus ATCC 27647 = CGMCC 1.3604]